MTSMATSKEEYRYNILNRLVIKYSKEMKQAYIEYGDSYEFQVAMELNNALCQARAEAEATLAKSKENFIPLD